MVEKRGRKPRVVDGAKSEPEERRGVQSIDIGMRILTVLSESNIPLPLKTISEKMGMAPSNVHRYLASFINSGLLRKCPATNHYDLGRLALRIGLSALSRIDILELVGFELKKLSQESGCLTVATVMGDQGPVVVKQYQPIPPMILSIAVGITLPLLRSPSGHVFLAYQPEENLRSIIDRELRSGSHYTLAAGTPKNIAEVRETAARVRELGYALNDVDVSPGLRAVACPVLNLQGDIIASLGLVSTDTTLGPDHPVLKELVSISKRLSEEAGHYSLP